MSGDVKKGHQIKKLEGHSKWVPSVAFSPCGQLLVSGSWDQSLIVWVSMSESMAFVVLVFVGSDPPVANL